MERKKYSRSLYKCECLPYLLDSKSRTPLYDNRFVSEKGKRTRFTLFWAYFIISPLTVQIRIQQMGLLYVKYQNSEGSVQSPMPSQLNHLCHHSPASVMEAAICRAVCFTEQ